MPPLPSATYPLRRAFKALALSMSNHFPLRLALGSGAFVLVLGLLATWADCALLAPPLGVTVYLRLRVPEHPDNATRNVVLGHGLALLCGLGCAALLSASGSALGMHFSWRHAVAAGLAVSATILATHRLRATHGPALATTLVASLGLLGRPYAATALFAGAILTALLLPQKRSGSSV